MNKRDPFFDIVKLLAVFMVVFRHVMFSSELLLFPIPVANATVGMNMPVFFIMSGWFAWPTIVSSDWRKLGLHLKSYMWPTIVLIVFFACIEPFAVGASWSLRDVFVLSTKRWLFGPWFIWTLCECYLLLFLCRFLARSASCKGMFQVSVVVGFALLMCVNCRFFFVSCLRSMFPYFLIGCFLRRSNVRPWEWKWLSIVFGVIFVLVVLLEGDARECGMSFYRAETSWRAFGSLNSAMTLFARPVVGVMGSLSFMWLVKLAVDMTQTSTAGRAVVGFLAKGGGLTLAIYLLHQWILKQVVALYPQFVDTRSGVLLLSVVLFCSVWFLADLTMNRVVFLRKWMWGRS